MPNQVYTLTQNIAETDADFMARVQAFVDQENYYYVSVGGIYPPSGSSGDATYLGFPPIEPSSDFSVYDPTNTQKIRTVTFSYDNTYYYIYLSLTPPIPPAPPTPTAGDVAVWTPGGAIADGILNVDTGLPNFTNLAPATAPGQAVEYTQISGLGSVTSVGLSMPAQFSVAGSPVTTSGTLGVTWANASANTVFSGPSTGSPSTPTFRSLVADDIPTLTASKISDFDTHAKGLLSGTAPVDYNSSTGAISMHVADTTHDGYLSSTDWNTFNGKQAAGNYITALTGDATASGPGSAAMTLATVNSNVGTYGSGVKSVTVTVNGKGLVTAITENTMTPAASDVTQDSTHRFVTDAQITAWNSIENNFRLTLTSGFAVTTSPVTAAQTIYCTPYNGNKLSLYDGSSWVTYTTSEFSIALSNTLTAGTLYDIFCYANAGVPTLELLAWTSTTVRATALALQDGVQVKSGDATRRYMGTFYNPGNKSATVTMTIASQCVVTWTGHNLPVNAPIVFTTTGALPTGIVAGQTYYVASASTTMTTNTFNISATPGGAIISTSGTQSGTHTATVPQYTEVSDNCLLLTNYYNALPRRLQYNVPAGTWIYTSVTNAIWNNNIASQLYYVCAVSQLPVAAEAGMSRQNSIASVQSNIGIGVDNTNFNGSSSISLPANAMAYTISTHQFYSAEGLHYLSPNHNSVATGTCTWNTAGGSGGKITAIVQG